MPGSRRSIAKRTALVLAGLGAGVLLFALCFEVVASLYYAHWRRGYDNLGFLERVTVRSSNPTLLWEYRPYGSYFPDDPGGLRTNRWGFRERDDLTLRKPEGVRRVAFIGDSVALGMRVAEEDTFVRRWEELANRSGGPGSVRAMNFGVDGYNTVQVRELLRTRVLRFEPDDVAYVFCLNDFDLEGAAGGKMRYFRRPPSFFLPWLRRQWDALRGLDYHQRHFRRNREVVFREILAMRDLLDARGAGFLVAIVPAFPDDMESFDEYPYSDIHHALVGFLRTHAIEVVDLLPVFEGREPDEVRLDIWHPSPRGHRLIARGLLEPLGTGLAVVPEGSREAAGPPPSS